MLGFKVGLLVGQSDGTCVGFEVRKSVGHAEGVFSKKKKIDINYTEREYVYSVIDNIGNDWLDYLCNDLFSKWIRNMMINEIKQLMIIFIDVVHLWVIINLWC